MLSRGYLLFFSLICFASLHLWPAVPIAQLQEISSSDASGLRIKVVPSEAETPLKGKPYKVGKNLRFKVLATNDSDAIIKAYIVDTYYQNRPKLYRENKVLPYRKAVAQLIRSKDADPEFIRVGSIVFLQPATTTVLEELNLEDWYGPLEPGLYRLVNKYRLDVDRPWTNDSKELLFEVVLQQ